MSDIFTVCSWTYSNSVVNKIHLINIFVCLVHQHYLMSVFILSCPRLFCQLQWHLLKFSGKLRICKISSKGFHRYISLKVFRYSFSGAIPMFCNGFKSDFILGMIAIKFSPVIDYRLKFQKVEFDRLGERSPE